MREGGRPTSGDRGKEKGKDVSWTGSSDSGERVSRVSRVRGDRVRRRSLADYQPPGKFRRVPVVASQDSDTPQRVIERISRRPWRVWAARWSTGSARQGSPASWRRSRGWLPFTVSTQRAPRECR